MFKFIHAADIHLDSPLHKLDLYEGAPVQMIRQATRAAFENLVTLAIDQQAAFVLISGDLYDGDWKDYNTGLYLISQMRRLRDAGISVFVIAGNHDAASRITKSLKLPEGVTILSSRTPETIMLTDLQVAIHGQSFASPAITRDLSADYPPPCGGFYNIGMLHTGVSGKEGHAPYAPCTIDGLVSKGYDYWALGHVHKREVLTENPVIVFPGNIQGRHIRETGAKGCLLVTVSDSGATRSEFVATDVVRWFTLPVDVSEAENGYEIIAHFTDGLKDLISQNPGIPLVVRTVFSGAAPAHNEFISDPDRWKNEIRAAAADISSETVWIEKIKINTRVPETDILIPADGPVRELTEIIAQLRKNPEDLCRMAAAELSALAGKLPPELFSEDDPLPIDDPEWLAMILDQIHPLLIQRLIKKGDKK